MKNDKDQEPIIAFDTIYSSKETQLLKLAIPYINPEARPFLAAIIKAKELSLCYSMIRDTNIFDLSIEITNIEQLLELAIPYCNEKQADLIRQMKSIKNTMQTFKNIEPFLKNMEQTGNIQNELFSMFAQNNNNNNNNNNQKNNNNDQKNNNNDQKDNNLNNNQYNNQNNNKSNNPNNNQNYNLNNPFTSVFSNNMSDKQRELFEKYKKEFEQM